MEAYGFIEEVYTKKGISVKMRVTRGTIVPGMVITLKDKLMKVKDIRVQKTKFNKASEGELVVLSFENGDYSLLANAAKSEISFEDPPKKSLDEIKKHDPAIDFNEITVDEMKDVYFKGKKKP